MNPCHREARRQSVASVNMKHHHHDPKQMPPDGALLLRLGLSASTSTTSGCASLHLLETLMSLV